VKAFDSDSSLRWLFCFTHPDDELAMIAWIRRLTKAGREVHLGWTHSNSVRAAEAISVAHDAGVVRSQLHFFGADDGRVCEQIPRLLPLMTDWIQQVRPDRVVTASFEQGHLDHDATNYLVSQSFGGPIFEFPLYHPYSRKIQVVNRFADSTGEEVLHLSPNERAWKRLLIGKYPSTNIRTVILSYRALRALALRPATFLVTERLRLQPVVDYMQPNLPPGFASEVARSAPWQRWLRAMEAISQHRQDRVS
jgi:hypothetical protein